jgi:predicted CoA-substrate-specific enzyme activase
MDYTPKNADLLHIGIDVGSTTVKAVCLDEAGAILWKDYRRHNALQPELARDFLLTIEKLFPNAEFHIFMTGSGGRVIAPYVNARYIQEVNAVTYAVETLYPDTGSVIELGGQDAKVIIWKGDDKENKSTLTFMNDKCAGGTGAIIDKLLDKIGITIQETPVISIKGKTIHHVAAKCGVFAETDVVGLLKAGVDREEIFISLCSAIVKQNLEVLVRGNVLRDRVLLLGGPHTYIRAFTELWRHHLPETWRIHRWSPKEASLADAIYVPADAQYFAAIGAVLFGRKSDEFYTDLPATNLAGYGQYRGVDKLETYLREGRLQKLESSGAVRNGLVQSEEEIRKCYHQYSIPSFQPPTLNKKEIYPVYLGIDGGSTSTKLAIISTQGTLLYKDYVLSKGNPILDIRDMFCRIKQWVNDNALLLDIKGTAVTGYASAILSKALNVDKSVVETVAHMRAATFYYGDIDIICDVGGQDIKVLFMKHGRVVDFKLNTQCSAGNGYFLQSMAQQFNIPVENYSEYAFKARKAPAFNYGCAVFMEQDKVNFQQLGWTKEEIMAGLALVLPLNIWNYVVQESNIGRFGHRIVLQGGTQKNCAAVKAQVDFIKNKIPHAEVHIHQYADIGGAIGAALELKEHPIRQSSAFIGIEAASGIEYQSRNDESTRCIFCHNGCHRTFIDIKALSQESIRFISGNGCERGQAKTIDEMRVMQSEKKKMLKRYPNLVHEASVMAFKQYDFEPLPLDKSAIPHTEFYPQNRLHKQKAGSRFMRSSASVLQKRQQMVIGIPRLLNLFYYAPFFSTYFRALGVREVVFSDETSSKLWNEGNKWGAIDPCFPAKVAPAHLYNLLQKKICTHICFPIVTHLESNVRDAIGNIACVIQMGTPEVVHAVFTRERDYFADYSVDYWKPLVRMDKPVEVTGLLYEYFKDRLSLTEDENAWAVAQGNAAMYEYVNDLQNSGRQIINQLIDNDAIGILMIGHPYHHDPGLNHGILESFQMRGYPILCIESIPLDDDFLKPLFPEIPLNLPGQSPFSIADVWQRNFNRNTNMKVWAAKVAARHPNLAVIDLSSFKCGHDAPLYSYIDSILDASETPHFLFHDIDQNKPGATFNLRIQTIDYFLKLEAEKLRAKASSLV